MKFAFNIPEKKISFKNYMELLFSCGSRKPVEAVCLRSPVGSPAGLECLWSKWKEKQHELESFVIHLKNEKDWDRILCKKKVKYSGRFCINLAEVKTTVDFKKMFLELVKHKTAGIL